MWVRDPGHAYEVLVLDAPPGEPARDLVLFVKREGRGYPGNVGHHPGTTIQEVLRAVHERATYVNRQIPCWQTRVVIGCARLAIFLLEWRAAVRHGRRRPSWRASLTGALCPVCGHVGCAQRCR